MDTTDRSLMVTGWINQVEGPIELLACGPNGKRHESLLVLTANPLQIHAALLLLGLQPGVPPKYVGVGPIAGPEVELHVEWTQDGKTYNARAEQLIYHMPKHEPVRSTTWTFTGSTMINGEYKALAEESLVATYWDPWAIFNITMQEGTNDEAFIINSRMVPPLGTSVLLRIKAINH